MKFIITKSQREKAALNWLNKKFSIDQLEIFKIPKYPYSIFFKKNGKIVMEKDNRNNDFWFDYDEIYSIISEFFDFDYNDGTVLLEKWLEENFGLTSFTPMITGVQNSTPRWYRN